ncbi:L domain-like protein, partial [Rhizoclosmatium globosum]
MEWLWKLLSSPSETLPATCQTQSDKLSSLPIELLIQILVHVDVAQVFRLRRLSHRFNSVLTSTSFAASTVSLIEHNGSHNQSNIDSLFFNAPPLFQRAIARRCLGKEVSFVRTRVPFIVPLPGAIGSCTLLTTLSLTNSSFCGRIPSEIGLLKALEVIVFRYNSFSGAIPSELYTLVNLKRLVLSNNLLTDVLSPDVGNLEKLVTLSIDCNRLTGVLPKELGLLKQLKVFDLNDNCFQGPVPIEICGLKELQMMNAVDNAGLTSSFDFAPLYL